MFKFLYYFISFYIFDLILIIFLLLFNIFLKKYFKILLTGLSTNHIRRYILESWKRITANVIAIVNSSIEL
jgi:hypothetical protein